MINQLFEQLQSFAKTDFAAQVQHVIGPQHARITCL